MAIETIRMQVRGMVALVAEPGLVLVALAATAQSNLAPDPIPHRSVPEFVKEDPVVLSHPAGVSNAGLGGGGGSLQEGLGGRHGEPRETPRAVRERGQNDDTCDCWKKPCRRSSRLHEGLPAAVDPYALHTPSPWRGRSCGRTWSTAAAQAARTQWPGG